MECKRGESIGCGVERVASDESHPQGLAMSDEPQTPEPRVPRRRRRPRIVLKAIAVCGVLGIIIGGTPHALGMRETYPDDGLFLGAILGAIGGFVGVLVGFLLGAWVSASIRASRIARGASQQTSTEHDDPV
jgi:hypothetical protein